MERATKQVQDEVEHAHNWKFNDSTAKTFQGHFQLTRSQSAEELLDKEKKTAQIRSRKRDSRKHIKVSKAKQNRKKK